MKIRALTADQKLLLSLSFSQLVAWGSCYYAYAVLMEPVQAALGISRSTAAGAYSLGLLVMGLTAIPVGLAIDRGRHFPVLIGGTVATMLGMLLHAAVQTVWQLYAVWALIGAGMAATLYESVFAFLIRAYPDDYRKRITFVTLLGGLASTVFIPLGAWLITLRGWRQAVMIIGSLQFFICLPIHAYWLRGEPGPQAHHTGASAKKLVEFTHHFPFWGLALFFVLFSGITTAMGGHLVSILRERNLPEAWVIAIPASIGALQVAGRLLLFFTEKHMDVHKANRWIPTLLPAALFVLALYAWGLQSPWVAIFYALLYGMANGMITIVKATAMATYVSRERAASLNGLLGFPTAIARAVAPSMLAALWAATGNYILGLSVLSALAASAVIAFWFAQRRALA